MPPLKFIKAKKITSFSEYVEPLSGSYIETSLLSLDEHFEYNSTDVTLVRDDCELFSFRCNIPHTSK